MIHVIYTLIQALQAILIRDRSKAAYMAYLLGQSFEIGR